MSEQSRGRARRPPGSCRGSRPCGTARPRSRRAGRTGRRTRTGRARPAPSPSASRRRCARHRSKRTSSARCRWPSQLPSRWKPSCQQSTAWQSRTVIRSTSPASGMSKPQDHRSMPEPAAIAWHWSKRMSAKPPPSLAPARFRREGVVVRPLDRAAAEDEVPHGPALPAPDHERGRAPALLPERHVRRRRGVGDVHVLAGEPVGRVLHADVAVPAEVRERHAGRVDRDPARLARRPRAGSGPGRPRGRSRPRPAGGSGCRPT